jgi:hypothetical protein
LNLTLLRERNEPLLTTVDTLLRETIRATLEHYLLVERKKKADALAYERVVIRALKDAGICGRIKRAAAHDSWSPDAEMIVDGRFHFVEVKKNSHAQMGGGSVAYRDGWFEAAGKVENIEASQAIADLLNDVNDSSLHRGLERVMAYLSTRAHVIDSVPMSGFDEERWRRAEARGMLVPINRNFASDVGAIARHYERKNTYYIQIGGAGLFRLSEANPASLPVPVLMGRAQLEVRLGKAGKPTASLRVQSRLLTVNASPYTLDDPDSIRDMLKARRRVGST